MLIVDRYVYAAAARSPPCDLGPRRRRQRRRLPADRARASRWTAAGASTSSPSAPRGDRVAGARVPRRLQDLPLGAGRDRRAARPRPARRARASSSRSSGPSGCGKSTLLSLAAGLDQPSAGEVRAVGRSLGRLDEAELAAYRARDVAIVFQSDNLWPALDRRRRTWPPRCGWRSTAAGRGRGGGGARRVRPRRAAHASRRARSPAASSSAWRSPPPRRAAHRSSWPTSRRASSTRRNERSRPRGAARAARGARQHGGRRDPLRARCRRAADRVIEIRDGRAVR